MVQDYVVDLINFFLHTIPTLFFDFGSILFTGFNNLVDGTFIEPFYQSVVDVLGFDISLGSMFTYTFVLTLLIFKLVDLLIPVT